MFTSVNPVLRVMRNSSWVLRPMNRMLLGNVAQNIPRITAQSPLHPQPRPHTHTHLTPSISAYLLQAAWPSPDIWLYSDTSPPFFFIVSLLSLRLAHLLLFQARRIVRRVKA